MSVAVRDCTWLSVTVRDCPWLSVTVHDPNKLGNNIYLVLFEIIDFDKTYCVECISNDTISAIQQFSHILLEVEFWSLLSYISNFNNKTINIEPENGANVKFPIFYYLSTMENGWLRF